MSARPQMGGGRRWLRFNLVGIGGFVLQLAALKVLVAGFHFEVALASVLAVEAAIIHNFVWHERFTWCERERCAGRGWQRFLRFNASAGGVSLLGNAALMALLARPAGAHYLVVNSLTVVCCSLVNFALAERWVFAGPAP